MTKRPSRRKSDRAKIRLLRRHAAGVAAYWKARDRAKLADFKATLDQP